MAVGLDQGALPNAGDGDGVPSRRQEKGASPPLSSFWPLGQGFTPPAGGDGQTTGAALGSGAGRCANYAGLLHESGSNKPVRDVVGCRSGAEMSRNGRATPAGPQSRRRGDAGSVQARQGKCRGEAVSGGDLGVGGVRVRFAGCGGRAWPPGGGRGHPGGPGAGGMGEVRPSVGPAAGAKRFLGVIWGVAVVEARCVGCGGQGCLRLAASQFWMGREVRSTPKEVQGLGWLRGAHKWRPSVLRKERF